MYYTIGQRHGLGIGGPGDAWFVIGKIPNENILLVGQGDEEYLYSNRCIVKDVNWLKIPSNESFTCNTKFRYRQKDIPVVINVIDLNTVEVVYKQKARAVTPGQAAVFYQEDIVLGGGTIDEVFMNEEKRKY